MTGSSDMEHLPVFINLHDRDVLVIGGGPVAERKIRLLHRCAARVTVVAPALNAGLAGLRDDGAIRHIGVDFEAQHLSHNYRLVIAATDDRVLNCRIASQADAAGILCNAVDDNAASAFILPAIVDRSPVIVAIGTGGRSPVLARRLKSLLERTLPARIGQLAEQAGRWREIVKRRFPALPDRRRFWERFFDGPGAAAVLANRTSAAEEHLRRSLLGTVPHRQPAQGEAFIVGAGPGDPGLVTLRAQQLIAEADVIVHDRLVAPAILDFARKEADFIAVGKSAGHKTMDQFEINQLLIRLVRSGKRVCRLKGGDPFVFGRGGEEAQALAAAGQPYQIVPGVTAALGCAAFAGIPLTQRGVSRSVTLATASLDGQSSPDWHALAQPGQTLVLYMSVGVLETATAELLRHGLAAGTPAALVENGTTSDQRVVRSSLRSIAADARATGVCAPALLFVGESVGLSGKLQWFGGQSAATRFAATPRIPQYPNSAKLRALP
jgi:uroporphyrin-III C-methyltransferase/precorrin-2 dehydrogenase/sirohydrochlorin ferrochelatase